MVICLLFSVAGNSFTSQLYWVRRYYMKQHTGLEFHLSETSFSMFAACGHISCFWCVFNAMNIWHESNCPVCRHPYNHFPSICQLLHFLLMKLYPAIYKKRERQVTGENNFLSFIQVLNYLCHIITFTVNFDLSF